MEARKVGRGSLLSYSLGSTAALLSTGTFSELSPLKEKCAVLWSAKDNMANNLLMGRTLLGWELLWNI